MNPRYYFLSSAYTLFIVTFCRFPVSIEAFSDVFQVWNIRKIQLYSKEHSWGLNFCKTFISSISNLVQTLLNQPSSCPMALDIFIRMGLLFLQFRKKDLAV